MSPQQKCVVPGCCEKVPSSEVRWFSFPDSTSLVSSVVSGKTVYFSRRRLWLNKLGLDDAFLERDAVVCSLHFGDQDFEGPEGGKASLKDDAVPSRNLPIRNDSDADIASKIAINERQSINENEIETVEKSDEEDDDDDIQIIEPHREVITLDDDDCDEDNNANKNAPGESGLTNNDISPIRSDDDADSTPLSQLFMRKDKESIAVNKNNILPKLRVVMPENKSPSTTNKTVDKSGVENQDKTPDPSKQNGKKISGIITSDGKRFIVQAAAKAGQIKTLSPILITEPSTSQGPKKYIKIPDLKKIGVGKEPPVYKMQVFTGKKGSQLTEADVSDALKKQLSELLQHKAILQSSILKGDKKNKKIVPIVAKPIRVIEVSPSSKGNKGEQNAPSKSTQVPVPPSKNDPVKVTTKPNEKEAPPPKQCTKGAQKKKTSVAKTKETEKKGGTDLGGDFKYVDISDILGKKSVEEEKKDNNETIILKATQEEKTGGHVPFGISDIYALVNRYMIDLTFDVLGTKYVLKECGLHFEPQNSNKTDRTVAVIGKSTITCKDPLLLSGMDVSIGISNKTMDPRLYSKKVTYKSEKIEKKIPIVPKPSPEQKDSDINTLPNEKSSLLEKCLTNKVGNVKTYQPKNKTNNKNFIEKKVETPEKAKVVLLPTKLLKSVEKNNSPNVSSTTIEKKKNTQSVKKQKENEKVVEVVEAKKKGVKLSNNLEEEKDKDRRKVIKKRRILKLSTTRIRKLFKMPVSQMNPALRALSVSGSKFRRNRRILQENEREKKTIEKKTLPERTPSDTAETVSKGETGNKSEEEKSCSIRTRGATKGVKKDYRNFSLYGTTEETKIVKTKRKKPVKSSPSKKLKYSDKVGHIESFLEVVLEPDNKDEMGLDASKSYNTDDSSF